jgi:hypothetical protein
LECARQGTEAHFKEAPFCVSGKQVLVECKKTVVSDQWSVVSRQRAAD